MIPWIIVGSILIVLFIFYIFAVKGRRTSPKTREFLKWNYAHRGLHEKPFAPENSLKAFQLAADSGYGAELDVHLLKDGTLAVMHDWKLDRTTGQSGLLEDLTFDDLKKYRLEGTNEYIPTLQEVLEIFENKAPLIIELKAYKNNGAALSKAVYEVMQNYNVKYCIESFDPRCVWWYRRHHKEVIRGSLAMNFLKSTSGFTKIVDFILTSLIINILLRPDFLAYKYENCKDFPYRVCTKFWKTQGAAWTITTSESYQAAKADDLIIIFENIKP